MKRFFLFFIIVFSVLPLQSETTRRQVIRLNTGGTDISRRQQRLERLIQCIYDANGVRQGPTNQWARRTYLARYMSETLARLQPAWTAVETAHLIAQTVAESGALRHMNEIKPRAHYANYPGIGPLQVTHRYNYAQVAGCTETLGRSSSTSPITRAAVAASPLNYRSQIVTNPKKAFSEATEEGQRNLANSAICWAVNTGERHPRFKTYSNCLTQDCGDRVGRAVNFGPGGMNYRSLPGIPQVRREALTNAKSCLSSVNVGV